MRRHISFIRTEADTWRRDEEIHRNVLIDTATIPARLAEHKVLARVDHSFGEEELPQGLVSITGYKTL